MTMIFLSYSRRDTDVVSLIAPQIRNVYGYDNLWYDQSIEGGDDWWDRIRIEIQRCRIFLFFMSNPSLDSEYCEKELQHAILNRKIILPVRLTTYSKDYKGKFSPDLRDRLGSTQNVDLTNGYNDLSRLWGAINRDSVDHSISKENRWILYNQYEILKKLHEIDEDDEGREWKIEDIERNQTILSEGYEWMYDQVSGIHPPMNYADSEEVIRVLEMYRDIDNACKNDLACLEIDSPFLKFRGFDGNLEADYHNFTVFMIEALNRFTESAAKEGEDLNSHTSMMEKYQMMLRVWKPIENRPWLTKEDVERIVNAANH